GRINFQQIVVNTNAPVRAQFDSRSQAYTFELPYLFFISKQGEVSRYSLNPPRIEGRYRNAPEVTDVWDCKHVIADDVTYQFLICRTRTESVGRARASRLPFGASAYFILSDGKEASSSVRLVFGDDDVTSPPPSDRAAARPTDADPAPPATGGRRPFPDDPDPITSKEGWQVPGAAQKLADVGKDEFRLRFSAQTWAG